MMKRTFEFFKMVVLTMVVAVSISACGTDDSSAGAYADDVVGNYMGTLQNPTMGTVEDYNITVTRLSDTEVRIAPASGEDSATFNAKLESGSVANTLILKVATDILANNGSYSKVLEKLSYTLHLGGDDEHNVEVFVGKKVP